MGKTETQVKSKERVTDHGEVFTAEREVNAMLDLVKQETERIDSRFLEPACGNGNFLDEILKRKIQIVDQRYAKSQTEWERYGIIAVSSIYGVDILEDNTHECQERLFHLFNRLYYLRFKDKCKPECLKSIQYIFISDQIEKGSTQVEYSPNEVMVGDLLTKPLQGQKFIEFCDNILGDK